MNPFFPRLLTLLAAAASFAPAFAEPDKQTLPSAQVNALFRVLKADGKTVIGQVAISPAGNALVTIALRQADALVAANGRCAFNVKYDEVSSRAVSGTVNRLYSNDTLVAQNTAIDLQAGVLRSIMTQPYLYAGSNNVKVVLDADSATPSVGWLRVNVDGDCKAAVAAPPKPVVPPVVPGTSLWNALYNAWGYSNYAVTQLRGKGYARYADVVSVNAALTAAANAKTIERAAYDTLMARWNALAAEAGFKAAMAAITPATRTGI